MKKYEERNAIEKIEVKPVWLQKKLDLSYLTFSKTFLCSIGSLHVESLINPSIILVSKRSNQLPLLTKQTLILQSAAEKYSSNSYVKFSISVNSSLDNFCAR